MEIKEKIEKIQIELQKQQLDGWLLYDNHGSNHYVKELLEIPAHFVITRRFFYWIPQKGEPEKILHRIEADSLNFLPGKKHLYLSWIELEKILEEILRDAKKIAMEYSPRNANPYISIVDAGTIEVIRGFGIDILSSQDILQLFTSVLDENQIESHLQASAVLQTTVEHVWELISDRLREGVRITEYDVQQFMLSEFAAQNCISEDGPICAVNSHSALPHYMASKQDAWEISLGDFILVDLWCKKNVPFGVYADITRVAVAAPQPTPRQEEIFEVVKNAQEKAIDFMRICLKEKKLLKGFEVDDVCRDYIKQKGFGEYFTHRTGHNIDIHVHGSGAHLDHLETFDQRRMMSGMCFSIEPGIYIPDEFGIRLESNVLIGIGGDLLVTDISEKNLICLL